MLLLEREAFPRPKPCGGLLSGKALASLPWPLPEEIWECPIRGVSLVNNRGEALYFRQEKAFAVTVRRELLDQFLLEKARGAGAAFLANTPLTDLVQNGDGLTVATPRGDFRARIVIGADGYQSRTARAAGLRRQWSPWQTPGGRPSCTGRRRPLPSQSGGNYWTSFFWKRPAVPEPDFWTTPP
ncbi:MAG: hypothetical protein WBK69_04755, partial [bacterium]